MKARWLALAMLLLAASNLRAQNIPERAAMNRMKGAQEAPLMVIEISDLQCPFCARFARDVFPQIDSAYVKTGKVKWIFVNLPLPMHANSWLAAEAAMCAGGVAGQFWQMHDKLFATQAEWSGAAEAGALFARYANELKIPVDAYLSCVTRDQVAAIMVRDVLIAADKKPTGTPTFLVGQEPSFAGVLPFEEWQKLLDNALAKAAATPRRPE